MQKIFWYQWLLSQSSRFYVENIINQNGDNESTCTYNIYINPEVSLTWFTSVVALLSGYVSGSNAVFNTTIQPTIWNGKHFFLSDDKLNLQ